MIGLKTVTEKKNTLYKKYDSTMNDIATAYHLFDSNMINIYKHTDLAEQTESGNKIKT